MKTDYGAARKHIQSLVVRSESMNRRDILWNLSISNALTMLDKAEEKEIANDLREREVAALEAIARALNEGKE